MRRRFTGALRGIGVLLVAMAGLLVLTAVPVGAQSSSQIVCVVELVDDSFFDGNGDGFVSIAELRAFDGNGDGIISIAELRAIAPDNERLQAHVDRWEAQGITGLQYQGCTGVSNVAPTLTLPEEQSANEGTATSIDLGAFSDPDSGAPWAVTVDWGDGTEPTTFEAMAAGPLGTWQHTYTDNGTYPVTVTVTDSKGSAGTGVLRVAVVNVAPAVGAVTGPPDRPVGIQTTVEASASFADPGVLDTHTAVIDWGDGTVTDGAVTESQGSGTVSGNHQYAVGGTYVVTIIVTDKDGGTGQSAYQFVEVQGPAQEPPGPPVKPEPPKGRG